MTAGVRDVIGPELSVLFVGINPGLYSAAVGHNFARPGNRFWPVLHAAGFTPRVLRASEESELLSLGYGITNLVARPSASASEISPAELRAGARRLRRKAARYRPRSIAICGLGAYRTAFARPAAVVGLQPEHLGPSRLWLLPNPSGLNAGYQPSRLIPLFSDLRAYIESLSS